MRRSRELARAALLTLQLPYHTRHPLTLNEAHRRQQHLLAHREDNFLAQARSMIYAQPGMPYERLLRSAGCEYGDLASMVQRNGLEATLSQLFQRGVYLTVDEFKGRTAIIRG